MTEEWKPIAGFEGSYEVSDRGRVRSVDRLVRSGHNALQPVEGRLLTPFVSKDGTYLVVRLQKDGRRCSRSVARLVAETFVPRPPEGESFTVHHVDGRPDNNEARNLVWLDRYRYWELQRERGTLQRGEDNPNAVMTERDVRRIRADQRPAKVAHVDYGIGKTTFLNIRARRSWKHVR
jgi:hypothetical protein